MNNKGADQTARTLFAYGINMFSHALAQMLVVNKNQYDHTWHGFSVSLVLGVF